MVDRKAFLSLLSKHLYPVLRAEGFKGSGTTLRRARGPVVHVFNVQGSSGSQHCYLNLGAHLTFLPAEGGLPVVPDKLEESHCVFRGRIHPPPGPGFGWVYGDSEEDALESVAFIVSEWPLLGHAFFTPYESFPESFEALISLAQPDAVQPRMCLHYARIAVELGQSDAALAFARSGLERAAERATSLRADLRKVIAGNWLVSD